jgi:hypothetical protein
MRHPGAAEIVICDHGLPILIADRHACDSNAKPPFLAIHNTHQPQYLWQMSGQPQNAQFSVHHSLISWA